MSERRLNPRKPISPDDRDVMIHLLDAEPIAGEVFDVSAEGIGIDVQRPAGLRIGAPIGVVYQDRKPIIGVICSVTYLQPGWRVGVQWVSAQFKNEKATPMHLQLAIKELLAEVDQGSRR